MLENLEKWFKIQNNARKSKNMLKNLNKWQKIQKEKLRRMSQNLEEESRKSRKM